MKRNISIDFLRGIAILLVLGRHIEIVPENLSIVLKAPIIFLIRYGWMGVDLFFVLSGFLVSGLLYKEIKNYNKLSYSSFFLRRGLKIYPAFYFMIAITLFLYNFDIASGALISELFFVQNYFSSLWPHTWSLAVEEHFYLTLPLIVIHAFSKKNEKFYITTLLTLILVIIIYRLYHNTSTPFSTKHQVYPTHLRVDGLFWGVFLSYLYHFRFEKLKTFVSRNSFSLLVLTVAMLAPCLYYYLGENQFMTTIGFSFLYFAFGNLLLFFLFYESLMKKIIWLTKPIANAGFYSYSIYLWHMPVRMITSRFINEELNYFGFLFCYIFFSLFTGILFAKLIEIPVLKTRERYFPSRA